MLRSLPLFWKDAINIITRKGVRTVIGPSLVNAESHPCIHMLSRQEQFIGGDYDFGRTVLFHNPTQCLLHL